MKPTFNPQTHVLRHVRVELWKPDTQQAHGGPLIATGWKVCRRRRRRKKPGPAPHPEIPDLVESRVVPGLFFNFFQLSITYENRVETPPALVFRLLIFLESRAANGARDEILSACWKDCGSEAALRNAVLKTSEFLAALGVTKNVSLVSDSVIWG